MPSIIWKYCKKWWIVPPPDLQQLCTVFRKCSRLPLSLNTAKLSSNEVWYFYGNPKDSWNIFNSSSCQMALDNVIIEVQLISYKSDRVQFAPKCCINIFWRYIFLCSVPPTISVLLDEKGSEVETSVGPYNVGGTLILTCDILGGENIKNLYSAKWYNS